MKERALVYLGGKKCKRCNVDNLHTSAYDFHHHKGGKEANLSRMFNGGYKWSKIMEELNKCEVLCANCHREKHAYNEKIALIWVGMDGKGLERKSGDGTGMDGNGEERNG